MSHVTDVHLKITDLEALDEACVFLGMTLRRGQQSYRWWGRWENDYRGMTAAVDQGHDPKTFGRCAHAISVSDDPRAYEIGLVPRKDGDGWDLLYDSYDRKIEPKAGPGLGRLRQEYAVRVTERRVKQTLARKGFGLTRENLPNGRVRLRLRRR